MLHICMKYSYENAIGGKSGQMMFWENKCFIYGAISANKPMEFSTYKWDSQGIARNDH